MEIRFASCHCFEDVAEVLPAYIPSAETTGIAIDTVYACDYEMVRQTRP